MDREAQGHRQLVIALLGTLILWNVPYGWVALYPFKIFATWIHESSHALLMLTTGAGLDRLEIFRDTSGLAYPAHGVSAAAQALISSAGYVGTAFFGAVFLILGRTDRGGRGVLLIVAAFMALSVVVGIRNLFGVLAVTAEAVILVGLALWGGERVCAFAVSFLAAQSCINAVLDIRVLFGATLYVNGRAHHESDADTLSRVIGGAPAVWAAVWLGWSFAMFYVALRVTRPRPAVPALAPMPVT